MIKTKKIIATITNSNKAMMNYQTNQINQNKFCISYLKNIGYY